MNYSYTIRKLIKRAFDSYVVKISPKRYLCPFSTGDSQTQYSFLKAQSYLSSCTMNHTHSNNSQLWIDGPKHNTMPTHLLESILSCQVSGTSQLRYYQSQIPDQGCHQKATCSRVAVQDLQIPCKTYSCINWEVCTEQTIKGERGLRNLNQGKINCVQEYCMK
jgi:hypothetical protein